MSNEINYEINNCITNLDTLKILDKRAVRDLENNTHEIEQQEVLTIIREFIRLRNDYNKEKEKNKELEKNLDHFIKLYKEYVFKEDIVLKLDIRKKINEYEKKAFDKETNQEKLKWSDFDLYLFQRDALQELLEERN